MNNQAAEANKRSIAVVQMNSGDDLSANLKQAGELVADAAQQGAGLVILPETFAFIGDDIRRQSEVAEAEGNGPIQDFLAQAASNNGILLAGGTIPLKSPDKNRIYAACPLYDGSGNLVARYDKIHLFDVLVPKNDEQYNGEQYKESAVFYPGKQITVVTTPLGKLGLAVCYDLRFPEMFRLMIDQGAEIIAVPAAFTAATGAAHWHALLKARAVENLLYIATAGQVGHHANQRETYGHSMIINPWGETELDLGEVPNQIGLANADIEKQKQIRTDFPCLAHRVFNVINRTLDL